MSQRIAKDLTPFQIVLLWTSLEDEKGILFHFQAYSRASEVGEVDLEHASSLGGDCVGVHPMGLLWSLKLEKILTKLLKRDVMNNPLQVQLKLYDSDVMVTHTTITTPKVSLTLERWYVAPGVTRIQVKESCLRGALLLHPGALLLPPGEWNCPGYCHLFFFSSFKSLILLEVYLDVDKIESIPFLTQNQS